MANTTNFGWETPDDTDLVKDGALAMRTLGNAIDASLVDLKGGTTGQVLSKNTNTDMDFVWTTPQTGDITEVTAGTGLSGGGSSGAVTLTNTVATTFDAKGDLVVGTGADAFAKLVAGSNGDTLVADSSTPTGLKWAPFPTSNFIGVAAYLQGATVSFTQNVISIISFTSEEYDTDGFHSTSSNQSRITIPSGKGGKYRFEFTFWAAEAQGANYASFWLYKNGTSYDANGLAARWVKMFPSSNTGAFTGSVVLNCVAGDYFELGFAGDWATGNKTITSRWQAEFLGA